MEVWDYNRFVQLLDDFLGGGEAHEPREAKRMRILHAAAELFIRHGYRKASIAEVAAHAGVAKGTVYLYFKNKPELLVYAIAEEKKRYLGSLKPILSPGRPPRERLKEWIKMVFITGSEMPLSSMVMAGDRDVLNALYDYMDAHKEQDWEGVQEAFIVHLVGEALGDHGFTDTEIRDRAKVLLGLIYYPLMIADPRTRRGLSLERFADLFATMIVDGVGASSATPRRPRDQEV